jgi:hypothetical protein
MHAISVMPTTVLPIDNALANINQDMKKQIQKGN